MTRSAGARSSATVASPTLVPRHFSSSDATPHPLSCPTSSASPASFSPPSTPCSSAAGFPVGRKLVVFAAVLFPFVARFRRILDPTAGQHPLNFFFCCIGIDVLRSYIFIIRPAKLRFICDKYPLIYFEGVGFSGTRLTHFYIIGREKIPII